MTARPPVEPILLVEEKLPIRRLIRRALQGYQVIEVSDAEHAMVTAERHISEIDLLVTDVMLPDLDGCDLAYCLGGIMKVLFVTRDVEDSAGARTRLRSPSFLLNPFSADELLRRIRLVLDRRPLPA